MATFETLENFVASLNERWTDKNQFILIVALRFTGEEIRDIIPSLAIAKSIGTQSEGEYVATRTLQSILKCLQQLGRRNSEVAIEESRDRLGILLSEIEQNPDLTCEISREYRCIIVQEKTKGICIDIKEKLLKEFRWFRDSSLNLWNLSADKRDEDWHDIHKKLTKTKGEGGAAQIIASISAQKYQLDWTLWEYRHETKPSEDGLKWGLKSGGDLCTLETIKRLFRFLKTKTKPRISQQTQLYLKDPVLESDEGKYFLWVPFFRDPSYTRYGAVFTSITPINQFVPKNIQYFISQYYGGVLISNRFEHIAQQITNLQDMAAFNPSWSPESWLDLYRFIRTQTEDLLDGILELTSAYRVSIRRYDIQAGGLRSLITTSIGPEGVNRTSDDNLILSSEMANALVKLFFDRNERESYNAVISDLSVGSNPRRARSETRSEYFAVLEVRNYRWGTINVESRYPNAFDAASLEFLRSCINAISGMIQAVFVSADKMSFVRGLAREDDIHEARQQIERSARISREEKDRIRHFLERSPFDLTGDGTLKSLRDYISNIPDVYQTIERTMVNDFVRRVEVYVNTELRINKVCLKLILIVVRNLVDNSLAHGRHENSENLDSVKILQLVKRSAIQIDVITYGQTCNGFLEKGGLLPLGDAQLYGTKRSGLLIVGNICRALGGFLTIRRSQNSFRIRAFCPYIVETDEEKS